MPAKRFAAIDLIENEWTNVFVNAYENDAHFHVSIVNNNEFESKISLALVPNMNEVDFTTKDVFVLNQPIRMNASQFIRDLYMGGDFIFAAYTEHPNITLTAFGIEREI